MSQKLNSPQFESPAGSSDQEFTYMAIGMVAGAVPGIIAGLLIALFAGHAAMWVSITGGIGIVLGLIASRVLYRKKKNPRA
ncbi:MAG: hypothetical protein Q4A03_04045 [Rothia sp. (in: high G+C Gram-positive bacteria)]|uniref:hypothetical protein n=1 Tax=Rothia sp. (in: high G+C Gram-positive bacteria) TaxID=1885016 RepID=UPI0026F5ECD8|nr:hypothetical protein [Rothia sp. (in: high G+C Gram-positive bacteria)]